MKIYTKTGDQGQTDLMQRRVTKADLHISVNGSIDETMATILIAKHEIEDPSVLSDLDRIHGYLFDAAHEIALDDDQERLIEPERTTWVEQKIDELQGRLPVLKKFIRLDRTKAASALNMVRVTMRRAERELILLNNEKPLNPDLLAMFNRLSDYFFVLGRTFNRTDRDQSL
ncbi:MAG: cob(I)yrinic acid a,c-diamide adenosyltransferase [Acholeplasmataceae bacterium]